MTSMPGYGQIARIIIVLKFTHFCIFVSNSIRVEFCYNIITEYGVGGIL